MQTNLLIMDNQNEISARKPGYVKGSIEGDREQGGEKKDFSSTLAEVENEQPSHPGPADESKVERKKRENGEVESEDLKKDANGETESEDIKEDANGGLATPVKTSGPVLVLGRKAGAGSEHERVVGGEALSRSGLKVSLAKLKVINKAEPGVNQADHKLSMDPDKANALKVDAAGLGLERKQGESDVEKVAEKPQGFAKVEGLLHEMVAKSATKSQGASERTAKPRDMVKAEGLLHDMVAKSAAKSQGASEGTANPRDMAKTEGLLHDMVAKSATKSQGTSEGTAKSRDMAKAEGALRELGEESGRINRGAQGREQADQKTRVGRMKSSPEELGQKRLGAEGAIPKLDIEPKDARSETLKANALEGGLTHKKVEKTEPNSGENSNLFSRNYSTPDKETWAVSHSKEPQVSTKSSQADTLKQIVKTSAFNLENGRSEFKIDLKPESLGHLKMQILTENHHVTVKILTQSPLVKEMIESNLAQLKASFQSQGLEIEKFDVSVAQDSNKNGTGDGGYESKRMRGKLSNTPNRYDGKVFETEMVGNSIKRVQQESSVDFFA